MTDGQTDRHAHIHTHTKIKTNYVGMRNTKLDSILASGNSENSCYLICGNEQAFVFIDDGQFVMTDI